MRLNYYNIIFYNSINIMLVFLHINCVCVVNHAYTMYTFIVDSNSSSQCVTTLQLHTHALYINITHIASYILGLQALSLIV